MAGCKPRKPHLAATIQSTESIHNQGDLKPPITCHCLPGTQGPSIFSYAKLPFPTHQARVTWASWGQQAASHNQFGDTELLACVALMPVDRTPPGIWAWHLMVIKTCVMLAPNISYIESSRPSSGWKFWQLYCFTENWVKNIICVIFSAANDLVQGHQSHCRWLYLSKYLKTGKCYFLKPQMWFNPVILFLGISCKETITPQNNLILKEGFWEHYL